MFRQIPIVLFLFGGSVLMAQDQHKEQMTFGKFALYKPLEHAVIETYALGHLTGKSPGTLKLKTGGKERAMIETYSFNQDTIPDLYVIRRESGQVISLGLDTTSSQYLRIQREFGDLMEPELKEDYQEGKKLL